MTRSKYIFLFFLLYNISFSQTYSWTYVGDIVHYPLNLGGHFFIDSANNFINFQNPHLPYKSTDEGKTWTQISSVNLNSLTGWTFNGDTIGSGLKITEWNIFRTTGATYNLPPSTFFSNLQDFIYSQYLNRETVVGDSGKIFVACNLGLIYSNDSGYTWFSVDVFGQRNNTIADIIYDNNVNYYYTFQVSSIIVDSLKNIMTATREKEIFYSANNGNSWMQQNTGLTDTSIYSLDIDSHKNIYAVTSSGKIFKGTVSMTSLPVEMISFSYSVKDENVLLVWITATETNNSGFDIERSSIDNIHQWRKIGFVTGSGTSNSPNQYSFIDNAKDGGHFRYRLKQIDRDGQFKYSQELAVKIIPGIFSLFQNYPNPFNPSTTIKFSIPTAEYVSLKVFDVLGKEVASTINEFLPPGTFTKEYSFKELPSGMYIYKITAGKFTDKKRMLLIK